MGATTLLTPEEFRQLPKETIQGYHAHPVESDDLIGAPVLAIEVVSTSNTAEELDRKVKAYLANGAVEAWVVYPKTRSVWVFRAGRAEQFIRSLRSPLIPDLEIDLERLLS